MPDVIQDAPARTRNRPRVAAWSLRLVTAAALAVDAFVHADLAGRYDANHGTGPLSQGDLFRIEAAVSACVALALLLTGRTLTWIAAWLVATSAVGAMLWYRYRDPGAWGPLPDMYEPLWFREKVVAGVAEGIAVVTAALGLLEQWSRSARSAHE